MNTVVWILILLTAFNFLLKQTFWQPAAVLCISIGMVLFAACMWPYAVEQSSTQIAAWLADPKLMLDTAIVLTVEVALQITFCLSTVHVENVSPVKKRMLLANRFLYWFPGMLIFPVVFFGLTRSVFAFPGVPFSTIAWGFAGMVGVTILLGRYAVKYLLPERDLRLELFFMTNVLVAVLGVIATVNGRTTVEGGATVDGKALLGCIGLIFAGGAVGFLRQLLWKGKIVRYLQNRRTDV